MAFIPSSTLMPDSSAAVTKPHSTSSAATDCVATPGVFASNFSTSATVAEGSMLMSTSPSTYSAPSGISNSTAFGGATVFASRTRWSSAVASLASGSPPSLLPLTWSPDPWSPAPLLATSPTLTSPVPDAFVPLASAPALALSPLSASSPLCTPLFAPVPRTSALGKSAPDAAALLDAASCSSLDSTEVPRSAFAPLLILFLSMTSCAFRETCVSSFSDSLTCAVLTAAGLACIASP